MTAAMDIIAENPPERCHILMGGESRAIFPQSLPSIIHLRIIQMKDIDSIQIQIQHSFGISKELLFYSKTHLFTPELNYRTRRTQ